MSSQFNLLNIFIYFIFILLFFFSFWELCIMFEKIVSDVLSKFLGKYIEGLNKESLKIAIWSGEVSLTHLQIKKEALDLVDVPVNIKGGVVGKLYMSIPWRKVMTEPLVLRLSDVHVIIGPRKEQKVCRFIILVIY